MESNEPKQKKAEDWRDNDPDKETSERWKNNPNNWKIDKLHKNATPL